MARLLAASSDATLHVNAAGAVAAVESDAHFDWRVLKGFALVGRTAGLMATWRKSRRIRSRGISGGSSGNAPSTPGSRGSRSANPERMESMQ